MAITNFAELANKHAEMWMAACESDRKRAEKALLFFMSANEGERGLPVVRVQDLCQESNDIEGKS